MISEAVKPPPSAGRWTALDGLRGIMAIWVFMSHVNYDRYPGPIIFMDTFFLMSSFLITRLLLKDWTQNGRIDFKGFYIRRLKRLYPALLFVAVATTAFTYFYLHQGFARMLHVLGAVFYFSNWLRALQIPHEFYLGHTWSLAIEEQYYLSWPLLLYAMLRFKWRPGTMLAVLLAVALASALWRASMALQGANIERTYNGTDMRLDGLAVGAILALGWGTEWAQRWSREFAKPWVVWLLILTIGMGVAVVDFRTVNWYVWQQPAYAMLSLMLVMALLQNPTRWGLRAVFQNRAIVYLGTVCYGVYLWHYPILVFGASVFELGEWTRVLVCGALTVTLASLSYFWVEQPLLHGRTVVS